MAKKRRTSPTKKRTGIFIYCSEEFKDRVDRARKRTGRTISGYVTQATLLQLERDEDRPTRRKS